MAEHYSRIIGTEEDKVNCPFYFKIGACRHGDGCSRTHLRPHFSQTLMIPHLYIPPAPGFLNLSLLLIIPLQVLMVNQWTIQSTLKTFTKK